MSKKTSSGGGGTSSRSGGGGGNTSDGSSSGRSHQSQSQADALSAHEQRLKLLKCFTGSKHKCRYICTVDNESIEALSGLMSDFIRRKLKVPKIKKIIKMLQPVRHLIRILADSNVKTSTKRKILLQWGIRYILYPILSKTIIPCFNKACKHANRCCPPKGIKK